MFDIGVNLTSTQFAKDRDKVVKRAREAGISGMLITGTNALESQQALSLARQHANYCWSTAGVHPHHASEWSAETAATLRRLAESPLVVAIGECGLDFNRNFSQPEQQVYAFNAQLALAAELSLPVFLHCREAHERFITILKPWLPSLKAAVLHCFTGARAELESCLAEGLSIGITGWICDERRGQELRELVPLIPADRLLLETDAPWLLPRDMRPRPPSRRNEPCFLPHIVQQVALLRGDDVDELAAQTALNARALFGL
ncbi:3'-5' ssDNA/RNA exonuclease TatD [Erwinia amylovora]|uniref:3'-5' ssDNA/RNA exonuclease TatD n=4 Tax=Erwinia amylovora TaxID=552 RepID=TATD_ERWAE|nr:3'-5' ssDNA/RNA exonuclease TatD [Erwinia amylovora]D4ICL5.1 RecName: Full=3'-5' ssDNA/RNA exonuclease TatD; AltName: Full=DNase TatD [Erwinia amylovora ATCC 49946]CDK13835.1 cytoplasmic Dnase [Erwinia amylovora LA635]CDK17202.1 cytoplasmic Dnase [Erwinia amylovora LA636]CDK20571.1 cytoplasmic Dnase [Erwinia amylovora LA637]ATZ10182.1 Tat-linked quality control protein TatD [Erwinia amylovora]EKV55640.1 cytoplasmic Dnase [Erwinia amylovora ACW56400]